MALLSNSFWPSDDLGGYFVFAFLVVFCFSLGPPYSSGGLPRGYDFAGLLKQNQLGLF